MDGFFNFKAGIWAQPLGSNTLIKR